MFFQQHSPENEQLVVDLYQARRLQYLYLDIKARQTFEKQEEKAKVCQIFSSYCPELFFTPFREINSPSPNQSNRLVFFAE